MLESDGPGAVLITGATGGIGTSVTETLHDAGWNVSLLDLAEEPLAAMVGKLNATRENSAIYHCGNAAAGSEVAEWVDESLAKFGAIDGLVNVAGLWRSQAFAELSLDDIDTVIEANLRTAIICCKFASVPMVASGRGSIVNFASTAGEYGSVSPAAHYAAAKGGVIALTKSLARELSPLGVRVNAVSPGPIDTSGFHEGSAVASTQVGARTLLGRLGTPREIATCVTFLLSSNSSFVTGHVLRANGGSLL